MTIEGEVSPWFVNVQLAAEVWKGQPLHVARAYFAEVVARVLIQANVSPEEKERFMEDMFTLLEGLVDQRSRLN